jgi:hypothetical protein
MCSGLLNPVLREVYQYAHLQRLEEPMQNSPSIGQIVHYAHPTTGIRWEAIVTGINEDGTLMLTAFPPPFMQGAVLALVSVPAGGSDNGPVKGCWNWPTRASGAAGAQGRALAPGDSSQLGSRPASR